MRTPYYVSRTEHPLDDSPLDLAPQRIIAPRRRLGEFSADHPIYRAPDLLINNELTEDSINRVMAAMTNTQQPESPAVIIIYYYFLVFFLEVMFEFPILCYVF